MAKYHLTEPKSKLKLPLKQSAIFLRFNDLVDMARIKVMNSKNKTLVNVKKGEKENLKQNRSESQSKVTDNTSVSTKTKIISNKNRAHDNVWRNELSRQRSERAHERTDEKKRHGINLSGMIEGEKRAGMNSENPGNTNLMEQQLATDKIQSEVKI